MMKKQATRPQARPAVPDSGRKVTPLLNCVLQAARRRCDDFQDGPKAREQMRLDVMATPPELLADLLVALSAVRTPRTEFLSHPTTTQKECNP